MIYAVSGQAAGGTSMMMRVLVKGGIDGNFINKASPEILSVLNNPYGCFENKDLTKLDGRVSKFIGLDLAEKANGTPVKVVRVIRKPLHIVQSRKERKMRGGRAIKSTVLERMDREIPRRSAKVLVDFQKMVDDNKNIEALYVNYEDMFKDTENQCRRIAEFIAPHPFDIEKAVKAVDKKLYKERDNVAEKYEYPV
jgi:hypothetical protein